MDGDWPGLVWGTWENKPCSVNAANWFPSGKPWPIWAAPSDRRCYFLLSPWFYHGEPVALIPE